MLNDHELTLSVSAFKAQCLDIMARIASRKLTRVTVTKRGKPVAVIGPFERTLSEEAASTSNQGYAKSWGAMRGSLAIPADFDWQALDDFAMPEPNTADLMAAINPSRLAS